MNLEFTILQTDYFPVLKSRLNSSDLPDVFMSNAYLHNDVYRDYWYDLTHESTWKTWNPRTGRPIGIESQAVIFHNGGKQRIQFFNGRIIDFSQVGVDWKAALFSHYGLGSLFWGVM